MKDWIHRTDAVGVEDLEEMARATGLLAVGQTMSPQLLAYTQAVVEQCASIADAYPLMARSNSPTLGHPKFPQAGPPDYDDSGATAMRAAASLRR